MWGESWGVMEWMSTSVAAVPTGSPLTWAIVATALIALGVLAMRTKRASSE